MSRPQPVGRTSQRWRDTRLHRTWLIKYKKGTRLWRTRHSCRGDHQEQRRRGKIASFPLEGSGSTCCATGCSSHLWRLYYHISCNYIIILVETGVGILTCGEVRRPVVAADCKEDGPHCRHCCSAPSHLYYKIYCAYRKRRLYHIHV